MMRKTEIKFRGKSIYENEWIEGYCVGSYHIIKAKDVVYDFGYIDDSPYYECYPDTISQFTGLYDNNGEEVYEGDIIKSPNGNIVIVEFGTHKERVHSIEASLSGYKIDSFECTGWIVRNIKNNTIGFLDYSFLQGEIIGNIYDNKELLK